MSRALTTKLSPELFDFIKNEAVSNKTTMKYVIEKALKLYRKSKLQKEIAQGLLERQDEYQKNLADFHEIQINSL